MAMTNDPSPLKYDETSLAKNLHDLPWSRRVIFASSCAERLMPTYHWLCLNSHSNDYEIVREALDAIWNIDSEVKRPTSLKITTLRVKLETLVALESDEGDAIGSAVAENAIAAVAYALRTWETDEPQESIWAARQIYEAADTIVQQSAPNQTYLNDIQSEAPVQLALQGIETALRDAQRASVEDSIVRAKEDGKEFLTAVRDLI
jgi:uncharacterized protein YjaG (DUF416 family)